MTHTFFDENLPAAVPLDLSSHADPLLEARGPAQLTNMRLAMSTLLAISNAPEGSPRIGLFYGHSGYGKTMAAAHAGSMTEALYIEACSIWTTRSLLEAIATELGIVRIERTAPRLLGQVIERLVYEPRALIIDEADHIAAKKHVDVIRDIHDKTPAPIMLIGEEALPAKLKAWERFDNRILAATAAQPSTIEDARKLRDHYCLRVTIADDLIEKMARECSGVTRRIVVNLRKVQQEALDDGQLHADLSWWGNRTFLTGALPIRRKVA